jgi:hypothetical protein
MVLIPVNTSFVVLLDFVPSSMQTEMKEGSGEASPGCFPQETMLKRRQIIATGSEHSGPKDLLVGYRTSWGILPQTPVFSLRSAHYQW